MKIPVEMKINHYGDASDECYLVLIENVSMKVDLEKQLIQNHFEIQKAYAELKTTQDALLQAAKLASLGELSSGIAHELNQPLQAILGFSQELEHLEKLSDTGKEFLGDIIHASKKMAEIIKSLRSFARQSGDELIETDVEHAVREASHLMHHQLMAMGIQMTVKAEKNLPLIVANGIQLEQVMINFMSNARDAIEQTKRKDGMITVTISGGDEAVVVTIKDNGCGMDSQTQSRIFDPFFTTKEVGKGMGLGMSISYGILKRLHAEVSLKSKLAEGTEFQITLPTQSQVTQTRSKR